MANPTTVLNLPVGQSFPVNHQAKAIGTNDWNGHEVEFIKKERLTSPGKSALYFVASTVLIAASVIFTCLAIAAAVSAVSAIVSGFGAPVIVPAAIFTVLWTALAALSFSGWAFFCKKID